jgi:hypothetical protein
MRDIADEALAQLKEISVSTAEQFQASVAAQKQAMAGL